MEYKLKDIAHINQETVKKDSFPNSFLYLDTKNLTSGKFGELAYFDSMKDKVPSRARRVVKENDILISTVRPNQRHYGFITKDQKSYIVSTGFAVITPEETKVNPYFLYKYLTLENITHYLQSIAENSTSAYPAIKPSVLSELSINLPDITIQDYISKLLRSLDDKINLNEQIIANLEELSQTLFKRWFVDFEFPNEDGNPYKSSGGEMIDSELGKIPLSWKVQKLNDIFKINYGKNLPTKKILNNGYPVFGGNGIIGYYSNYMYETPKILISCRGAASGKIHISKEKSFVTNNSIVLDEKQKNYFYYFKELYKYNDFKRYTTGSAQPQITIANIKYLVYLTPNTNIIDQFNSELHPVK
ncbi:restriction endonuclease subunit S [Staphylococcus cohnii]|uniref:restriction endonuclease subunit S n=1 Tax=Staphylococcus cohnii TaxID=29382 RepID=UPI0024808F29|nr:restriction endonuclease subunit S [Staphylococcus cohnii]MDE1710495.1 restriction endonuclease subunit S [Staphylococcus cohnii]